MHAKRFKNAQFSLKNATHADLDGSAMRRDAKRDAPWPTKTPNCGHGVMGLLKGCTKMDQNRPKWSPYYDPSMTKHKCFKFFLYGYFNPILIQMDT